METVTVVVVVVAVLAVFFLMIIDCCIPRRLKFQDSAQNGGYINKNCLDTQPDYHVFQPLSKTLMGCSPLKNNEDDD